MLKALKEGGEVLQENTKMSLRRELNPGATQRPNRWNGKTMEEGIKLTVDKAYTTVVVSILKDFRLWIFENGTGLRTTEAGYNRGSIDARNFFASARTQSQSAVESAIVNSLNESLSKIQ